MKRSRKCQGNGALLCSIGLILTWPNINVHSNFSSSKQNLKLEMALEVLNKVEIVSIPNFFTNIMKHASDFGSEKTMKALNFILIACKFVYA